MRILIWIAFSINILTAVLGLLLVESPAYLLQKGDKDGAIKALKYVAKINGVSNYEVQDLKEEKFETSENN